MTSYNLFKKTEQGWERLVSWIRPFFGEDTLDDTLDTAQFTEQDVINDREQPFTRIKVEIVCDGQTEETLFFVVSDMQSEKRTFA